MRPWLTLPSIKVSANPLRKVAPSLDVLYYLRKNLLIPFQENGKGKEEYRKYLLQHREITLGKQNN
jgi:hypothetical protein